MSRGIGLIMEIKKRYPLLFMLLVLLLNPVIVSAQEGIQYCIDRYGTDDINQCIYNLHQQGISFVDPLGGGINPGLCSEDATLDAALSLGFPSYSNDAQTARKIEDYIRSKRSSSPWLTVENLGQKIIEAGKESNANPFIMIQIGWIESHFSTDNSTAVRLNNPFGIKAGESTYKSFATVEEGLFNENGILSGLQRRLAEHSNYLEVNNMYEYFSVHNTGQILYPGDNVRILDPAMGVYVSSEGDTGYGPVEYWQTAMDVHNELFGTDFSTTTPTRKGASTTNAGGSCSGSFPPGDGGWDLPGGPNPLAYFSQLYACDETPPTSPEDRSFAKTCDDAVGENAFGSGRYGSGTIEKCGCGPTSMATIVTTLTGKRTTPIDIARWAEENNGVQEDGCGSSWFWETEAAQAEFSITVTPINSSQFASTLNSGKLILVSLTAFPLPGNEVGHISVIRKVENGSFYFADTYSGAWSNEDEVGSSRMAYSETDLSGMYKGAWAIGAL